MDIELLKTFCDHSASRQKWMSELFSSEIYTYATNSKSLVRVNRINEVLNTVPESIQSALKDMTFFTDLEYLPLPEFPSHFWKECSICQGEGYVLVCPECRGKGIVEWRTAYNFYSDYCKMCFENKFVPASWRDKYELYQYNSTEDICPECLGKKSVFNNSDFMSVHNACLSVPELNRIKQLPDAEIAFPPNKNYVQFRFDGGEIILMKAKPEACNEES